MKEHDLLGGVTKRWLALSNYQGRRSTITSEADVNILARNLTHMFRSISKKIQLCRFFKSLSFLRYYEQAHREAKLVKTFQALNVVLPVKQNRTRFLWRCLYSRIQKFRRYEVSYGCRQKNAASGRSGRKEAIL